MKDRPILFSIPMVNAILDGRKTQTRRIVKSEVSEYSKVEIVVDAEIAGYDIGGEMYPRLLRGLSADFDEGEWIVKCPYGGVGDILWVREDHYMIGHWEEVPGVKTKGGRQKWQFIADSDEVRYFDNPPTEFRKGRHSKDSGTSAWHKRLARFMPKSACRIFLENVGVWVERLNDISDDDAIAEGLQSYCDEELQEVRYKDYMADSSGYGHPDHDYPTIDDPIKSYKSLWQLISGEESWEDNPWVWVIEFKKIDKPA